MDNVVKFIILMSTASVPAIASMAFLYFNLMPCDLGNLGYMYFPVCSNARYNGNEILYIIGSLLRILSPCIFVWVISETAGRCILEYLTLTTVLCYVLMNYLYLFQREYLWKYNRSRIQYLKCVRMFKEIQILMLVYNGIFKGPLSVAELLLLSLLFIISFYAVIGLLDNLILPQLLLFLVLAFCSSVALMVVVGIFKAGVYKTSNAVQLRLSQYRDNKVKSNFRLHCKYLKSWPVLRVYIAGRNFYDEKIGLVLLHFNISQVVNMLLM